MKKFYCLSMFYTIIALIGGVFYREFTKFHQFTDKTTLSIIHTHAFILGTFFFLILLLLEKQFTLTKSKKMKPFLIFYNSGLVLTIFMLLVRGILTVLQTPLSNALTASISGIAGIGHLLLGIGFIYFFLILKDTLDF